MKIVSDKLDAFDIFNLTQEAEHIKKYEGVELEVIGIEICTQVDKDGVEVLGAYIFTSERAYFGSAASFINAVDKLGRAFGDKIAKDGLKASFHMREIGKKGNTIWNAKLVR